MSNSSQYEHHTVSDRARTHTGVSSSSLRLCSGWKHFRWQRWDASSLVNLGSLKSGHQGVYETYWGKTLVEGDGEGPGGQGEAPGHRQQAGGCEGMRGTRWSWDGLGTAQGFTSVMTRPPWTRGGPEQGLPVGQRWTDWEQQGQEETRVYSGVNSKVWPSRRVSPSLL